MGLLLGVMLELLLTRFDDRGLFATPGTLRFLMLDEVHTYTGRRGPTSPR